MGGVGEQLSLVTQKPVVTESDRSSMHTIPPPNNSNGGETLLNAHQLATTLGMGGITTAANMNNTNQPPNNTAVVPQPPPSTSMLFNSTSANGQPLLNGDNIPSLFTAASESLPLVIINNSDLSPQSSSAMQDEEFAVLMSYRCQSQLNMMRGSDKVIWPTTVGLILLFCYGYWSKGIPGLFLLPISLLPSLIYLLVLRRNRAREVSVPLLFEMFWAGGVLSMVSALALESFAAARAGLPTDGDANEPWGYWPYIRATIISIVCIGFAEELSKILPTALVKTRERDIPYTCTLLFRYVDSPYAYVLSAAACAAGFAAVENVSYVFGGKSLLTSLLTSIVRSVLSVPFHIACTTFVASKYANMKFHVDDNNTGSVLPMTTGNLELAPRAMAYHMMPLSTGLLQPSWLPPVTYSTTLWSYIWPIAIVAVLHGGFDCPLLIAQRVTAGRHSNSLTSSSTAPPTLSSTQGGGPLSIPELELPTGVELQLALLVAASMTCAVTVFIIALIAWHQLKYLPNPHLRLARYYEQHNITGASLPVFHSRPGTAVAVGVQHNPLPH